MDIRQITPDFYAAPQISPEDAPAIASAGIRLVICNRPDIEVPPSHQAAAIEKAVRAAGMDFAVQPLTHQTMTPAVIAANRALMETAEGPVLAYCASGTRSTIAWAIGSAGTLGAEEIIAAGYRGGYDLSGLKPTLEGLARG